MANAYYGAGAKFSHPCYEWQINKYVCPCCGKKFATEASMENHYLNEHSPSFEEASEIVRWQRLHKHFNTPKHQKREAKKKERRKVNKEMKKRGYSKVSKTWRILGYSFVKESKLITYEDALVIIS